MRSTNYDPAYLKREARSVANLAAKTRGRKPRAVRRVSWSIEVRDCSVTPCRLMVEWFERDEAGRDLPHSATEVL